jgi:hypothetical protein
MSTRHDDKTTVEPGDGDTGTDIQPESIDAGTPWEPYVGIVEDMPATPQVESRVNIDHLSVIQSHVASCIAESRLAFSEDGLFIRVKDPANVAAFTAWLDQEDFIVYHVDEPGVIGLSWGNVGGKIIDQPAKGERVDLTVGKTGDDPRPKPKFTVDDGILMRGDTIAPDALRDQPDPPTQHELDMESALTVTGTELRTLLNRISNFSDVVTFQADPESGGVMIRGDGDTSSVEKTYTDSGDVADTDKVQGFSFQSDATIGDTSKYSLEYLRDFVTGPRKSELRAEFTARFGDQTPLRLTRELADNSMIRVSIAPRKA